MSTALTCLTANGLPSQSGMLLSITLGFASALKASEMTVISTDRQPDGVPNKPVLPTATTSLNLYAPGPLRRQTGQSLGARRAAGLRDTTDNDR